MKISLPHIMGFFDIAFWMMLAGYFLCLSNLIWWPYVFPGLICIGVGRVIGERDWRTGGRI